MLSRAALRAFAAASTLSAETTNPPSTDTSIASAVQNGVIRNHLTGRPSLGDIPDDFQIGRVLHVDSYDVSRPSYELVEITSAGKALAVATVNDQPDGYSLGSLAGLKPGTRLPTQAMLDAQAAASSLTGHASLAYGPTVEGSSELLPFIVANDSAGRGHIAAGPGSTPEFAIN